MNCPGMFEFIIETPVRCLLCHGSVTEKTLVDKSARLKFQPGIPRDKDVPVLPFQAI